MNLSLLDKALWAASLIGHAALLLVLVWRKRFRTFPVFTLMMAFEVFSTLLLLVVENKGSRHAYFLAYWVTGFADYGFQVALIIEIAREVLRPTGTWVRDARKGFVAWGSVGLILAAAMALQLGPAQSKGFDLWDSRITVFTSLLTCELFIAVATTATRLGLQWRSNVISLSQGLTLWAFIAVVEDLAHAIWGWEREFHGFTYVRMFAYLSVLIYWTVTFWLPERVRAPLSPEMNAYLVALHRRVQYDLNSVDGPNL